MNRTKYSLLITALCFFFATKMEAQKLVVESFTSAPTDISASKYPRQDLNGHPCGLVKVQLAVAGAQFEGNVIAPVEYKTGEYWVYMTEGTKELVVKTPSTVPLHVNFGDYQIGGIVPKATYLLTLTAPKSSEVTNFQYLVLNTIPDNSTVTIDGQKVESLVEGSGSVSALLTPGTHTYLVEAIGYVPEGGTVEIGDSKRTLEVTLRSIQAKLTITCPTSETQLRVNEQFCGTLPWTSSISAGNYVVEVSKEGFRTHRETIRLSESEVRKLNIPALHIQAGSLNVNYQPIDAEVFLDGQRLGTSPDVFNDIPIGNHEVKILKAGYVSKQEVVSIQDGQIVSLTGQLQAKRKSDEISNSKKPSKTVNQGTTSVVTKTQKTKQGTNAKTYQKPTSLYLQANGQVGSLMALGVNVGGYFYNVNLEAYYLYGLSRSEDIYWMPQDVGPVVQCSYAPMVYGLKVGYGIITAKTRFRLTPQLGVAVVSVRSTDGSSKGYVVPGTVGLNATYTFTPHIGLYLTPEMSFALKKSDVYTQLADVSYKIRSWGNGFNINIGLRYSF